METTVKYAVARLCNAVKFRTLHLLCKPLIVLLFLLYGGFFFGCSTENEIGNSRKSPSDLISLSGETRTRASIADLSTMESDANGFTVFGTLGNTPTQWYTDVHGNVLDGVNRHKYISGIWRFAPDVYWPVSGYPITFYALYPASPTGLGAWDYGFSPFKLRAPYTVPPTASAQQDVMAGKVSTLNRPSSGEENIAFDHILTCIDFRVIAGIGTTPEIQSVQLVNIRDTRTYDFATGNWEASVTGNTSYTYYGTVVPGGSGGSTLLPLWSAAVADETTSNPFYTTTTTPTAANAHLMLMPQTSSSWVPAHGVAPTSSSGGYVSIIYRMGTGSGTTGVGTSREVGYASANQHPDHATLGGGYTGPLFVKAGFPLPGGSSQFTWQRGNGYIYHVGLGTPNSCNGMIVDEYYYNNLGNRTNLKLIEVMTEGKRVGDKLQDGEIHLTLGVQKWEDQPISTQPATTVKVTPQFVYIPHSAQTPATQTLTVLCYDALGNPDPTGSWTLSVPSSATWLTMTLHSDGVTNVGSTISGTGNATVYLVPTANTTSNLRLAELYLNNVVSNVVSTVVQDNAGGSQGTPPVGTTTYAGAFWRATQTGERIIRINMGSDPATQSVNWGSWNAFVAWTDNKWHPAFNDGVILSTDKLDASSLAARSISYSSITTPQDAEHLDSRVISHATVVGGTVGSGDFAQFRIGLQNPFSIWHPTSNPARYALVIFLYGTPTKAQKIFVRQGEGADVMATGVNAARWSVYNVTGKNGATPTDVLPDFTEYPSQAGYYKIFSTASTLYAPIGTLTLNSELDGSAIDNICPEGYKLPNSDGTNAFSSTNEMGTLIATGTESVWGYYADGFFDRRQIVGSLGSPGEPLSAVNVSTVAVAYAGRLHYNITTNASLFMPGAGGRSSSNMPLLPQNAGSSYTYWSRTHTSGTHGWVINSGKNTSAVQVQTLKAAAYSVRCVSDFCVPVTGVVLSRTPSDGAIIAGNSVLLTATVSPLHATDVVYIWQRYSANTFMWETFETTTQNTCTAIITSFGMNQFRVLASNDCGGATSAPMLISGAIPGAGGSAARVTWDAAANGGAGEYVITYEPRNAGLLFKYGGVVGIYTDHEVIKDLTPPVTSSLDMFHPTDVAWTPEGSSVTYTHWNIIPFSSQVDIDDTYHNATNVKAGRGDPCRLVGLDLAKIQSSLANELTKEDIDNGIWRLPTNQDNIDFSGYPAGTTLTSAHWWSANQLGNISYGVQGAEFPSRNNGGMHKFLPATGFRNPDGLCIGHIVAHYWSSENASSIAGSIMDFASNEVNPTRGAVYNFALPVRCVPNICIPITTATVSPSTATTVTGNTIQLTASVTSGATHVTYQWQRNTLSGWVNIPGETGATCSVIVYEVGNNQYRVITANGCSNVVSAPAIITGTVPVGGTPARITWDAAAHGGTGGYVITHDPRNAGLLFKYGGVVGIYSNHESIKDLTPPLLPSTDIYHPTDVAWTPEGPSITYATWNAVPARTMTNMEDITLAYHNPTNIKAGFGDPCRLVGLNLNTIQNLTAGALTANHINNFAWRLPTNQENMDFAGFPGGNNATTVHWWSENQSDNISFGVAGAEFPSRGSSGLHKYLPAAGVRAQGSGTIQTQGTVGSYWSNEIHNILGPRFLDFGSDYVRPDNCMGPDWAVPVRCIYDPCMPVQSATLTMTQSGNLAVGTTLTLTAGVAPSNVGAPITYIWERSIDSGINWQQIGTNTASTTTAVTLTTYVAAVGGNWYRVRASNPCAATVVTSNTMSITGTEPAGGGSANTNANVYVGAYWRATERGERIIRVNTGASGSNNAGPWVATVLARDARFSATDIVFAPALTPGELTTRNISWTTPQEPNLTAESYLLSSSATSIYGTAAANEFIELRIGLNTYHTNSAFPARYAVVLLSYGNGKWQKIYIRQGHEPDFLMRNVDGGTGVPVGRPDTREFSPYNLTDPNLNTQTNYNSMTNAGTGLLGAAGGVPVDYPSKAGYFFQFNVSTRAFHPVAPLGAFTNWNATPGPYVWDAVTDETCPPGYRRPTDGLPLSGGNIADSEIRQSLWTNPPVGNPSSGAYIDNSAWGYYADGFFDRRALNSAPYGNFGLENTSVSHTNQHAAYIGRLFYNQATRASLFFPAPGYRANGSGELIAAGREGYYWSGSTSFQNEQPWHTYFQTSFARMTFTLVNYGYVVRCVVDPPPPFGISLTSVSVTGSTMLTGETIYLTAAPSGGVVDEYEWWYHNGATWAIIAKTTDPTYNATIVMNGSNQFRVVARNATETATSNIVTITGITPLGGSSARITWEEATQRYVLTTDPRDAGLYFKIGSVIGVFSGVGRHTHDMTTAIPAHTFDTDIHVTINLSTATISGISTAGVATIPNENGAADTIDAIYHETNMKAGTGRGDPCRLVGLDLNNIANKMGAPNTLTTAEIDNGLWRLPSLQEWYDFSEYSVSPVTGGAWWWTQALSPYGVVGGEFRERGLGGIGKFLPAIGQRNAAGTVQFQALRAIFLSNDYNGGDNFEGFNFTSGTIQFGSTAGGHNMYGVRCVRQ